MSEATHSSVDVSSVSDPDVRRVLRAMHQEYTTALAHQRAEIDAILEVLLEKHVTSVGELRRQVAKLQQQAAQAGQTGAGVSRSGRLHDAIWGAGGTGTPGANPTTYR